MARPIWKGSISFGLVTIPVQVLPATSAAEKISFKMLRRGDLSPIKYKRVAETDGKEVPWEQIVKGYEYEKGRFVTFEEKDFDQVELESVDSIALQEFVDLAAINPIFFDKPYYLEPLKGGASAYGLLRDMLAETNKVGIANVVMRGRQHLAALKANGPLLVLELMHFQEEIAPAEGVRVPAETKPGAKEKEMAKHLIEQMTGEWDPAKYTDQYAGAVMKLINQKVKAGGKQLPTHKRSAASAINVIDLVAVLEQSLKEAGGNRTAKSSRRIVPQNRSPRRRVHRRAAA